MAYWVVLISVTLAGLVIATITDFRKREVPDWLSYGLISAGIGLNLAYSLIYSNYWLILSSIIGLLLFLIIALIMFYSGQWGGGDSKVLMGLGTLTGLDIRLAQFPFIISLLINILLVGAAYGLLWSVVLVFRNWKGFYREFKKISHGLLAVRLRTYLVVFVVLMLVLAFFYRLSAISALFLGLAFIALTAFYLWISVKAVEKACMLKLIEPTKLTEGDWIAKEVRYNRKYICGPKDLGIEKKQIGELLKLHKQNKIKKVLIKEGIPFVPSFLIAYIITLFFGNLFFILF